VPRVARRGRDCLPSTERRSGAWVERHGSGCSRGSAV